MKKQNDGLCAALMVTVALYVASGKTCVCLAQSPSLDDLREVVAAKGDAYGMLRARLTKAGNKWDVDSALKDGWATGLAAFIINTRVDNRDAFAELDAASLVPMADGRPTFRPRRAEGVVWQAFVLEQTWKALWPEELCTRMIERSVMKQPVAGPTNLWQELTAPAVGPNLRAVGVYGLCKYETFNDQAADLLTNNASPSIVRRAVLCGMDTYKPSFARDVIVKAMPQWANDDYLRVRALMFLAGDSADASRGVLHQWLGDERLSETMRTEIVNALSANPKACDADVYRDLLQRESLAVKIRETVQRVLKKSE